MADYTAAVAACEEGLELDWIALILVALSLSDGRNGSMACQSPTRHIVDGSWGQNQERQLCEGVLPPK